MKNTRKHKVGELCAVRNAREVAAATFKRTLLKLASGRNLFIVDAWLLRHAPNGDPAVWKFKLALWMVSK